MAYYVATNIPGSYPDGKRRYSIPTQASPAIGLRYGRKESPVAGHILLELEDGRQVWWLLATRLYYMRHGLC